MTALMSGQDISVPKMLAGPLSHEEFQSLALCVSRDIELNLMRERLNEMLNCQELSLFEDADHELLSLRVAITRFLPNASTEFVEELWSEAMFLLWDIVAQKENALRRFDERLLLSSELLMFMGDFCLGGTEATGIHAEWTRLHPSHECSIPMKLKVVQ